MFRYNRILLKLSGEALAGPDGHGYNGELINNIAKEIQTLNYAGIEIAIVVGGGNIIRGGSASKSGHMDRCSADYMGMLATMINALALQEGFNDAGLKARAMSTLPIKNVCDTYIIRDARKHLSDGEVVILGGGTGTPFFTTDTNAALRACDLNCECVLKATKVDGVYDSDPEKNPNAKKYNTISYGDVLEKNLRVMDLTAISMCMDNNIPVIVFNMDDTKNIIEVLQGNNIGTLVNN